MADTNCKDSITLDEELYFGSVPVTLGEVPGKSSLYTSKTFRETTEQAAKDIANARNKPLASLGEEYANLVIPAIPATDPVLIQTGPATDLPSIFKVPLLKTEGGPIPGIQSGRRSALVKYGGKWYRLKGCGDLYLGFPFGEVEFHPKLVQIRGSMFEYTVSRELIISDFVNTLLSKHGLQCANKSVGWFKYELPGTEKPLVGKYCFVAETLGNRRLGDNVLIGLERLLPFLVKIDNISEIFSKFPSQRRDAEKKMGVLPTSIVSLTGDFGGEQDFHDFHFTEITPREFRNFDKKWNSIWEESCLILEKYYSSGNKQSLLPHLYWRLGFEIGKICRIFNEADFSWGTYEDILGTHCNRHVNNLVLLPYSPSNPTAPLLAPLDFDMAFTKNSFSRDESTWSEWMTLEQNGLKLVLGGDTTVSTGVTASVNLSEEFSLVRDALRDTMVCGFNFGHTSDANPHPPIPSIGLEIHALVKLALVVAEKETA